jgi:hypothetical protein
MPLLTILSSQNLSSSIEENKRCDMLLCFFFNVKIKMRSVCLVYSLLTNIIVGGTTTQQQQQSNHHRTQLHLHVKCLIYLIYYPTFILHLNKKKKEIFTLIYFFLKWITNREVVNGSNTNSLSNPFIYRIGFRAWCDNILWLFDLK